MKNPNLTKTQSKAIARSFSNSDWIWLSTQMAFLDAMDEKTEEEIRGLADVLLTERFNATV